MEIERLKTLVALANAAVEELEIEYNAFVAKKNEWYDRNLTLNHSSLMTNEEFTKNVWDEYQEYLNTKFDSDVFRLKYGVKNIVDDYEKFQRVSAHLDEVVASEENRLPVGWKLYEVTYFDKLNSAEYTRNFYAPDEEEAAKLCEKAYGMNCASVAKVIELKDEECV